GMFIGFRHLDAEHCRGGDIHYAMSVGSPVEAADQRNRQVFTLDDTRRGSIDPSFSGKRKSEHFSLGNGALVRDAGKLTDAKRSVIVNDRAFRAHAAK